MSVLETKWVDQMDLINSTKLHVKLNKAIHINQGQKQCHKEGISKYMTNTIDIRLGKCLKVKEKKEVITT